MELSEDNSSKCIETRVSECFREFSPALSWTVSATECSLLSGDLTEPAVGSWMSRAWIASEFPSPENFWNRKEQIWI